MQKLVIVLALLALASPSLAFWRVCHRFPTARLPDHIETHLCDAERCFIVRGQNFVANITLSSPESHVELLTTNFAFIWGVGVELPMEYPHDNGCNALFIGGVRQFCPTQPNRQYVWVIDYPLSPVVPPFQNAIVEYTIRDRGTLVGCVEFTATVV